MIAVENIAEFHLELTERCNAACPMCGRMTDDGAEQPFLRGREMTLATVKEIFTPGLLRQLTRFRLCGNFGDPAVARDVEPVLRYLRSTAPSLRLTMNTNGGVRPREWWYEIANVFRSSGSAVLFAIDGLADTHAIYRRRTSFERVLENAEAFVRGGGRAHWVFLVFEHNEHQIQAARSLARSIGFQQFTVKRTKRFGDRAGRVTWNRTYRDARDSALVQLRAPNNEEYRNPRLRAVDAGCAIGGEDALPDCRAMRERSLYVSAGGLLFPCCWLGAEFAAAEADPERSDWRKLVDELGGAAAIDLRRLALREILAGPLFERLHLLLGEFPHDENDPPLKTCVRVCSPTAQAFEQQFEHEQLHRSVEIFEYA